MSKCCEAEINRPRDDLSGRATPSTGPSGGGATSQWRRPRRYFEAAGPRNVMPGATDLRSPHCSRRTSGRRPEYNSGANSDKARSRRRPSASGAELMKAAAQIADTLSGPSASQLGWLRLVPVPDACGCVAFFPGRPRGASGATAQRERSGRRHAGLTDRPDRPRRSDALSIVARVIRNLLKRRDARKYHD